MYFRYVRDITDNQHPYVNAQANALLVQICDSRLNHEHRLRPAAQEAAR